MNSTQTSKLEIKRTSDRELEAERVFDAPRELVFEMWTKAEHLKHWWGPTGWTLPVCEIDFRPGGSWFYCMAGPDDMQSCGKAVYHEIVAPEKIVYSDFFTDKDGQVLPDMPEVKSTLIFDEENGRTRVRMLSAYPTAEQLTAVLEMGMMEGFTQTIERLVEYLETVQ